MKNKISITVILTASLVASLNGCSSMVPNSIKSKVLKGAHTRMDDNKDGFINFKEYMKNVAKKDVTKEAQAKGMSINEYYQWDFNRTDTNTDGKVTLQEFVSFAKKGED